MKRVYKNSVRILVLLLFFEKLLFCFCDAAHRFHVSGPVVTLTLKDETPSLSSGDESSTTTNKQWINLSSLQPHVLWSISSNPTTPPLPRFLPSLQSIRATIGYRCCCTNTNNKKKSDTTFLEGDARFTIRNDIDIHVQPTYEYAQTSNNKRRGITLVCQLSKGASYLVARFCTTKRGLLLDSMRASYLVPLTFESLKTIRITPSFHCSTQQPSCMIETQSTSKKTKAVLNLQYQEPTLTVVHTLDERNTIAPEISLHTAKILYQWNVLLDNGGSIRTKVDPTSCIHVCWTDRAMNNGKWVTEFDLPLKAGTTVSALLAANVKVKRQFTF